MHYFLPASLIAIGDGPTILPGGTLNPPTSVHLAKQVRDTITSHIDLSHQEGASNLPAADQMDNNKSPNPRVPLAADVTDRSESSGVPILAANHADQSNSHKSSGGRPLAVDETDRSKSSGLPLLADNQVDQSNSHESSGGRPLAGETGHSKSSGLPLLGVDQLDQSN